LPINGDAKLLQVVKDVVNTSHKVRVGSRLRFGVFAVDLKEGELRKDGERIKIQEQPFQVLGVLLRHPNQIVTREQLRSAIWSADTFVDFDNGLNTAINKLREALGDSSDNPRFIETVPRRGYRFIVPVEGDGLSAVASNALTVSRSMGWESPIGGKDGSQADNAALARIQTQRAKESLA
jgi:DNA-binding winged helix-turn-helix (wHTH) protein